MKLFETAFTSPNDREWMQLRKQLETKIAALSKEGGNLEKQISRCLEWQRGPLKQRLAMVTDQLAISRDDYQKHIQARSKYESAGRQQLSLF